MNKNSYKIFFGLKSIFRSLSPNLPLFSTLLIIQFIQLFISCRFVDNVGIGLVLGTIAWAYALSLPQKFLKTKTLRGIYVGIVITISSIIELLALFCSVKLKELVTFTHILLISFTNMREASEFISTYVDLKFILIVVAISISCICAYILMRKVRSSKFFTLITIISLFSLIFTTYYNIWLDCGIGRVIWAINSCKEIKSYNLSETQPEYEVCETKTFHPNIILIIGESFDRNHSSLYGYDKETNPLLAKRQNDSTLIVYPSVMSPGPNTHLAIRQMLSLAERSDDELWYKKAMLPTALSKSGYQTCWISNQTPVYYFENVIGSIARLCDTYISTCKVNFYDESFDEVLFAPFRRYTSKYGTKESNFCVIHLTGSHFKYDARYPQSFAKFEESDYPNQTKNRRKTFASYDNSILYNDYVVDSLMSIADETEAIVIYAPDHGEDFYYTRDIATHGSEIDPVSFEAGCRIPFMIFFTKSFRNNHPEIVESALSYVVDGFNTKYLMNTIMDMSGYDICGSTVYDNSLFKGKFSEFPTR